MDIRVESLIEEIHKYREDFSSQLKNYKEDFAKYDLFKYYKRKTAN